MSSNPFDPWLTYSGTAPTAAPGYNISDPNFNLPYLPTTFDDSSNQPNSLSLSSTYNPKLLQEWIDDLRTELNDLILPGNTTKFTDTELTGYLNSALKDYSNFFKYERTLQISVTTGVEEYQLPHDIKDITNVVYVSPTGNVNWLKYKPFKAGNTVSRLNSGYSKLGIYANRYNSTFYVGHYDFKHIDNQNILWLDYAPQIGSVLRVEYHASHLLFTKPNSSLSANDPYNVAAYHSYTTVNEDHDEAILLYAKAKAFVRVEGQDANLSRWKETGSRTDNPIKLESTRFFQAYNAKIKSYRTVQLKVGRLYRR